MTWQPLDCHAHTTMSDGALEPMELLRVVRARGVRAGVADHASRDVARALKSVDDVREYLDVLEELPVLRGAEFCWHDALWREIPADLALRFTHRVGSLHAIFLPGGSRVHAFARRLPSGLTPEAWLDAWLANLERLVREMPVDILAHPTLLPLSWRDRPLEELWTEAHEARAAELLAGSGIAFELSNRYRVHQRFVRTIVDAGVRLSLGSDGHTAEQVGDVAWPLALARAVGVPDESLYDPAVHGSRVGVAVQGAAPPGASRA